MLKKIYNSFMEALNGQENVFTTGSIRKAIFMLAVPAILEMILESLFALVDVSFVSKIGTEAVAVVGITESVLTIIYSVAWGFSAAATAIVARRIGEGNVQAAAEAAGQVIMISLALALVFGVPGVLFSEQILSLMGANASLIASKGLFTKLMFVSSPVIILLYTLSGVLRGLGNGSLAMRSLAVANIANMLLDPLFIFGLMFIPAFGVVGAAIATTTGRALGVMYQLNSLSNGRAAIHLNWQHLKPDLSLIKRILILASGNIGQFLIGSASWIFFVRILATFGSDVVAGYTIAIRVIIFAIMPAWGLANAAATLVGQNLGAGQTLRAEQSAWKAAFYNLLFLSMITVLFMVFAPNIIGFFSTDPKVLAAGVSCLRIVSIGYPFCAYGMVIGQSLNGAGDTLSPTLINLLVFWIIGIPLAYFLSIHLQGMGVYVAIASSDFLLAFLSIWVFRQGKWKSIKV